MLNDREHAILKEVFESEAQMIWVVNKTAFIGNKEYPVDVVRKFLSATAIREIGTEGGIVKYELSATGKLIVRNPEAANQITYAIGANYGSFV